jgi:hypothetical protein
MTTLDKAITKLSDKAVQTRVRSATREAALAALKKEGIELLPKEWGKLTARMIAAKSGRITPDFRRNRGSRARLRTLTTATTSGYHVNN